MFGEMATHSEVITSVTPLNLALTSKTRIRQFGWMILTLAAAAAFCFVVVSVIIKYQQRDVKVITVLKNVGSEPFPAITLCNMNPYKKSALLNLPEMTPLMNGKLTNETNTSTTNNRNNEAENKRFKRASGTCMPLPFFRIGDVSGPWYDGSAKCNTSPLKPPGAVSARMARLIGQSSLCQELENSGILTTSPAWIDLIGSFNQYSWGGTFSSPGSAAQTINCANYTVVVPNPLSLFSLISIQLVGIGSGTIRLTHQNPLDYLNIICEATYVDCDSSVDTSTVPPTATAIISTTSTTSSTTLSQSPSTATLTTQAPQVTSIAIEGIISEKSILSSELPISVNLLTTPLINPLAALSDEVESQMAPFLSSSLISELLSNALIEAKNDDTAKSITIDDILPYILAMLNPNDAQKAGYLASELIARCKYNDRECYSSEFNLSRDPNYGNCYTFNYLGNYTTATRTGPQGGLSVTFNIGPNSDHLNHIQSSGARIVVHNQNEQIFPDVAGSYAPVGYQASFAIKRYETSALSQPSKPCVQPQSKDIPIFYYSTAYSPEACLRSCIQQYIIKTCGCGDPRLALPADNSASFCGLDKRDCVNGVYNRSDIASKISCQCPPVCKITGYDITESTSRWPRDFDFDSHYVRDGSSARLNLNRSQLIGIEVYYQDLNIVEYSEHIAYTAMDALLDVANNIGLFLGMSIISAFEILNIMFFVIRKCSK